MKKLTTVFMTLMLVFGLSGIAAAAMCTNCADTCDTPGAINRGCEIAQTNCDVFDYDDVYGYCMEKNEKPHFQAFINICECYYEDLFTSHPQAGDTIDISMEILVDKNDGNGMTTGENGVYWAEEVDSIGLQIYNKDENLCDPEGDVFSDDFNGPFIYKGVGNTTIDSLDESSNHCIVAEDNKAIKIIKDSTANGTGYMIGQSDPVSDYCWYSPDIPAMRADVSEVSAGWDVYVRICLTFTDENEGVCPIDCCMDVYIGSLCCGTDYDIVYPYVPNLSMDESTWWTGVVVTNVTSSVGSCVITIFESDGDVGQWLNVDVPANGNLLLNNTDMLSSVTKIAGSGPIGDSNSYLVVSPSFPATGYLFIGNAKTGKAMGNGYIPVEMPVSYVSENSGPDLE